MTKARDLAGASIVPAAVSNTELGFLDGVTSAVQTQLDAKAVPANVINNTFVDAKGDLITATANDTPARLGVGANNTVLMADSTTATGLVYSDVLQNIVYKSPEERCTVTATAATGVVAFNTQTQGVLFFTANATANFTLNFTNVNANLTTGDSISAVFLNTNGATAFYPTAFQIDGTAVTPKFSGGTAPAAGNINSIDAYSFTIIKTAASTYTVLAGGATKFA